MRLTGLFLASILSLVTFTGVVAASTLPPPPAVVFAASDVLIDAANKDQAKVAKFFADDVIASVNGKRIALGKAAWLKWWTADRSHYFGRTVGYSIGRQGDGALLVLDQFDTQDNYTSPPPAGDSRLSTRSTFYGFGPDHLIHLINISEVDSFYTVAAQKKK